MKVSIISAVLIIVVVGACTEKKPAVEVAVPAVVKESFAKQFPSAAEVVWSKEGEAEFEVEFKSAAGIQAANYDANGNWLITETKINQMNLTTAVLGMIEKDYKGYKIAGTESVEMPNQEQFFEVRLEQGEKTLVIQYTLDGKAMKVEEKATEKEDEEKD